MFPWDAGVKVPPSGPEWVQKSSTTVIGFRSAAKAGLVRLFTWRAYTGPAQPAHYQGWAMLPGRFGLSRDLVTRRRPAVMSFHEGIGHMELL